MDLRLKEAQEWVDFTEAMAHIRERELLYGPSSLLALFGPLVSDICANNTSYADKGLQAAAADARLGRRMRRDLVRAQAAAAVEAEAEEEEAVAAAATPDGTA
ncbi:condensin complex component cnd1 [Ophiocordyceps sinensis CO18]|uniref:Condensin complex component cnd1 n=1 Tax=Ophiocordyceps sinensis (strain Co18 / CGMCC 3.14243) TaxID=911162 RepID=T5ALF2_OPHSC|nr:condensin complex component cnd1 [Ophiocordyceps sinensis CO18]